MHTVSKRDTWQFRIRIIHCPRVVGHPLCQSRSIGRTELITEIAVQCTAGVVGSYPQHREVKAFPVQAGIDRPSNLRIVSITQWFLVVSIDNAVTILVHIDSITIFQFYILVWHFRTVCCLITFLGAFLIEFEKIISETLSNRQSGTAQIVIEWRNLKHLDNLVPCKGDAWADTVSEVVDLVRPP